MINFPVNLFKICLVISFAIHSSNHFHNIFYYYIDFLEAHSRPEEQNLFGIVQGGLDPVLR